MPSRLEQSLVRGSLLILLLMATVDQVIRSFRWGAASWQMGDWLIHYGDGFVRRGLLGTVFRALGEASGLPANVLVIGFSLATFLLLGALLLWRGRGWFAPGMLLSCVVLGFPAYQDGIVRKDCLELLLFWGCFTWFDRFDEGLTRWTGLNLLVCCALLIHEGFGFFALPALVLLDSSGKQCWKSIAGRALALSPAWITFALTIVFHGSKGTAQAIHDSWLPLWREIEGPGADLAEPSSAIAAVGWEMEEGVGLVKGIWSAGLYQPLAWGMVFGVSLLLVVAFTRQVPGGRNRMLGLLVFQLMCISPLFVLGIDYGRWLFLWVVSSMILCIHGRRLPKDLEEKSNRVLESPVVGPGLPRLGQHEWVFLFFGVPVLWNLRNFLTAGPVPHYVWAWFGIQ